MVLSREAIDEFREAWLASEGNEFASKVQRRSLEALADQDQELKVLLFALSNKAQSELDLHLTGTLEETHETNAESFASLISGIAEATKEVAKNYIGSFRRESTLRVLAPSMGSVRLVLRAAPPIEENNRLAKTTRTPSVDSLSLDMIATLLARSQSDSPDAQNDDVLSGLAANLPQKAHRGLKRAAKAIEKQDWSVKGELRTPRGFQPITIDTFGAKALLRVLEEHQASSTTIVLKGMIDGQRRSIGALWFNPEGQRPIEAAIPSQDLIEQVVHHAAINESVIAEFDLLSIVGKGMGARVRPVYTLRSIEKAPVQPTLL
jgi:hypothetical protein